MQSDHREYTFQHLSTRKNCAQWHAVHDNIQRSFHRDIPNCSSEGIGMLPSETTRKINQTQSSICHGYVAGLSKCLFNVKIEICKCLTGCDLQSSTSMYGEHTNFASIYREQTFASPNILQVAGGHCHQHKFLCYGMRYKYQRN